MLGPVLYQRCTLGQTNLLDATWTSKGEAVGMAIDGRKAGLSTSRSGALYNWGGWRGGYKWAVAELRVVNSDRVK